MFCLDQSTFSRRLRTFWRLPPVFPAFTWGPRYLLWTYRSFCSIISDTSRQNSTRARRRRLLHSTPALPFLFQTRSLYTKYERIHAHSTVPYPPASAPAPASPPPFAFPIRQQPHERPQTPARAVASPPTGRLGIDCAAPALRCDAATGVRRA